MNMNQMEAGLLCIHCNEEVLHVVTYLNNRIVNVQCQECHHAIQYGIDIKYELYKETYQRIATKPARITGEYKKDVNHFMYSLPIRIVKKPYRLMKGIKDNYKIIKKYQSNKKIN